MSRIQYGDYIYIQVAPKSRNKKQEPQSLIVGTGFFSQDVWAGKASNLNSKNYLNCLFQICPNQHSEKDKYSVEAENRLRILKESAGASQEAIKLFTDQIALEKKKANNRSGRVALLNLKEKEETNGYPVRLNTGKFTLRHVVSGMFLDIHPRVHNLDYTVTDMRLTYSPNTENSYTLVSPNQATESSETAEYGVPLLLYSAKYNLYICHTVEPYQEVMLARELNFNSRFINSAEFPKPLIRRQECYQENQAGFLVGGQVRESCVVFENYKRKKQIRLKTGDYVRFMCDGLYLTILWYGDNQLNRVFFQSFESADYQFNQCNTIFHLVQTSEEGFPTQEIVVTTDIDQVTKKKENIAKKPPQKYWLKHYVSGCFLVLDSQNQPTLATKEQISKDQSLWCDVFFAAKSYEGQQQIGQNFGFVLGFIKGNDTKYLTTGGPLSMSKDQDELLTGYYFGSKVTDEYIYNKLRPQMRSAKVIANANERKADFKYDFVRKSDMQGILKTESLANQLLFFLNYIEDFKTPYERKGGKETSALRVDESMGEGAAYLNNYMRKVGDAIRIFMNKEPLVKSKSITEVALNDPIAVEEEKLDKVIVLEDDEESDDEHYEHDHQVSHTENRATRELRAIDIIAILAHTFFTEKHVVAKVHEINSNAESASNYRKFDNKDCIYFLSSLLELLLILVRTDHNTHLYTCQFTRTFLQALAYQSNGILSAMSLEEKFGLRELLLEVVCELLWDEDINSLIQLNNEKLQDDLFASMLKETHYQGLYIRLLNHLAQSKAPNFDNALQVRFFKNFLIDSACMSHVFPVFTPTENDIMISFTRTMAPSSNMNISLKAIVEAYKQGPPNSSAEESWKHPYSLAKYLLYATTFANSMAQSFDLHYYQLIIKHYPYRTLKSAVAIIGSDFYELATMLSELITKVHLRYLRLPIKNFPPQIQIAGGVDSEYTKSVNEKLLTAVEELISETEHMVIHERELKAGIDNCKNLTMKDISQENEDLIPKDITNKLFFISRVKVVLSDPLAMVSLKKLQEIHKNLCSLLIMNINDIKQGKDAGAKRMVLDILSVFRLVEEKIIFEASLRISEEYNKIGWGSKPSLQEESSPEAPRIASPISKDPLLALNKVLPLVDPGNATIDDAVNQGTPQARKSVMPLSNTIMGAAAQNAKKNADVQVQLKQLSKADSAYIEEEFRGHITGDGLIGILFDLVLLEDQQITLEVVKKLQRIANFKINLIKQAKKLAPLKNRGDALLINELISLNLEFNQIIRLFKCNDFFGKQVPPNQISEIFQTIDNHVNKLLITIYNANKHFRYVDSNKEAEERLLEGLNRWTKAEKDRPFKIREEAVNRTYQKVFAALKIPETLSEIVKIAFAITGGDYNATNLRFLSVIRKIIIILMIFVYKNTDNQNYLASKRFIILNFQNPKFLEQSCDMLLLFAEMLRDNKHLLKLPMRYLYNIVLDNFWGAMEEKISESQANSNLSAVVMSLHFLWQVKIEGKDPESLVKEKIDELFAMLSKNNPKLDFFELCSSHQGNTLEHPAIELPYYYFTIREQLSSWNEIQPKFVTSIQTLNNIFENQPQESWTKVLSNPSWRFHFDLRNKFCKMAARTWYGKFKLSMVQDADEFRNLMFYLFADLDAYITFMAKSRKIEELANYKFDYSWLGTKEKVTEYQDAYSKFCKQELYESKLFIYAEEISVMQLWKEYIYEGLIEFLNQFLLNEPDQMSFIVDMQNTESPNLLTLYLQLLEELSLVPSAVTESPFSSIRDCLQKASLIKEYSDFKEKILDVISHIRVRRPEAKTKHSTFARTRNQTGDSFENYIESLGKDRESIKELSTRRLANDLEKCKNDYKDVLIKLILALRRGFLKMQNGEVVFMLRLLRKVIEKENKSASETLQIYLWEAVKISELKKINYIQKIYQTHGLTNLIFKLAEQINEKKILKELMQLGLAYLYGGNSEVQEEFFEKFNEDKNSKFLKKLADLLDDCTAFFKETENQRMMNLYDQSLTYSIEIYTEQEQQNDPVQFFEKVIENYDPKDTLDALAFKENALLLLIASFLQALAEKQCNNIQNFLRDQRFNAPLGSASQRHTINFLSKFRSLFNSYYKVHNNYNVVVGYKIVDVLNELIQGDVPLNLQDVCKKTFLYDLCRLLTEYNNQMHLLARGYGPKPYQGSFMELKSKIIGMIKSVAESPNHKVVDMLRKYADLKGLLDVFEGCMYEYFGWTEDTYPKTDVFEIVEKQLKEITTEDIYGLLGDALNIYIVFRYIWEDKDEFAEEIKNLISDSGRKKEQADLLLVLITSFCLKTVRSVEILNTEKEVDLIKYWFPLFPVCNYLLDSTKENFLKKVDRTNAQTKIRGLVDASDELIPQMNEEMKARKRYLGINANNFYTRARQLTNILALIILFMNIFTFRYDAGKDPEEQFYRSEPAVETAVLILNIVNAGFTFLVIVLWLATSLKRHLSVQWERFTDEVKKEMQIIPQAVQEKFQQMDTSVILQEDCEIMLKFKGIYSDEFITMRNTPALNAMIRQFYWTQNIWFTISSSTFLWHLASLGFSIGSIFNPIVTTLLIADIAAQSDAIVAVLQAVTTNWKQFLWTLFLLLFVTMFYTFLGFYQFQDILQDGEDVPNYYCKDTFGCLLSFLDFGLRNGGGIGDALVPTFYTAGKRDYIGRVVYELSFFFIMITILLNLIFGMIVDAFGNLRDQRVQDDEDQENNCFICGINRSEFERYMSFDEHTIQEHNTWDYLYFIIYLREKYSHNKNDLNEVENTVYEKYSENNLDWIPVSRSVSLEKKQKEIGSTQENTAEMQTMIKAIVSEVKEVKNNLAKAQKKIEKNAEK